MANILNSVSSVFDTTRDSRISYNIAEKGAASLITGIFDKSSGRAATFYSSPDIVNSEETKLVIPYGTVMITPYLVDAGVQSSTNDPANILRTYRFITGDGTHEGIVPGPNGSQTENIYIIDKNKAPVPVANSDGTVSTGDVVLASLLGSAVASAPKLWDAIFNANKNDPTKSAPSVDPVTGQSVPTPAEKTAATVVPALDELRNVNTAGKGDDFVLVWSPDAGQWVVKPIQDVLQDALTAAEACGGAGGSGGNGGAGGAGGDGGSAGGSLPADVACLPSISPVEYPCIAAPTTAGNNGKILLPTIVNTANNEYTQDVPALGSKGMDFHFFADGCGKKAIWDPNNQQVVCPDGTTGEYSCLVEPTTTPQAVSGGSPMNYIVQSEFKIKMCLSVTICGNEILIYQDEFTESALSATSYSFIGKTVLWADTKLGPLLTKYPGQILNKANQNMKLYLQRTDTCGSEYPIYFEGYTRIISNETNRTVDGKPAFKSPVSNTTGPKPEPVIRKADDGKFPIFRPGSGTLGAPSCILPVPTPPVGPTPGTPGGAGTPGGTGTSGTCADITPGPPKAQPILAFVAPCAKIYGAQTIPPAFDKVKLASAIVNSGMANQTVTLVYTLDIGDGAFSIVGSIPGPVTVVPNGRTMTITGPAADVQTTTNLVYMTPANGSLGEMYYKAVLTNADMQNAGVSCAIVPQNLVITNSQAACSKLVIDGSTTGGTAKITITYNGSTRDLTNGYVPFNTSINQTAIDIAANINANVLVKNALATSDPTWLPKYVASATGAEISICSPAASGSSWNGANVDYATTGTFSFDALTSIKTLLGGATKNISDWLSTNIPQWDKVSDILYSIAGNVAGAVITNMIINNANQVQITVPELPADTKIAFLYKGMKVQLPQGYNGTTRTGMPTYAAWDSGGRNWSFAWTDNPVWCLYDYITNKVYGLGNALQFTTQQENLLLQDLFSLAAYCDELVTDENGNPQVRYSLNTVITDGSRLQILEQLCSVFRGAYCFHFGGLRITADRPDTEISLLVNQANAGNFTYNLSASGNFVNTINLSYVEPSNFYKTAIVQAKNNDAYNKYGTKSKDIAMFGCTDASQAIRYANWLLLTEKYNQAIVSYAASEDHFALVPGQIVQFEDSGERGQRYAGRIVSASGVNLVLDGAIDAVAGDLFSVTNSDGTIHQTTIASVSGTSLVMTAPSAGTILESATFIASPVSTGAQLYKVVKIDEKATSQYNITLQLYNPDKFATV